MVLSHKSRRRRAAALAAVIAAAMLGALLPAVGASAQQSGFTIEFLNPGPRNPQDPQDPRGSNSHSNVVSNRSAGGNTAYRVAAWVGTVPAQPVVEFELVTATGTVTIGTAQRVGDSNVWQFNWFISGVLDGNYTLRAILYDGLTQVAVDEQRIQLRHGAVDPNSAAPRTRFTYPDNNGPAAFSRPASSNVASILVEVVNSSGAEWVRVFYTTTPVGQQPVWSVCASEAWGSGAQTLQCTLPADLDPLTVTALAAVANNSAPPDPFFGVGVARPENDQAGDAIMIQPYLQVPSVLIADAPRAQARNACTPSITVQLLDQLGRRLNRHNVDAHAVGPHDSLRFHRGVLGPGGRQPQQGDHDFEIGWDCNLNNATESTGSQGVHRRPVLPNIKHVHAPASGTNRSGIWQVRLYSPDVGDTHLTFWADANENDVHDPGEPCVATAVRWGDTTPDSTPTPQPEFQGCAIAAPGAGPQPPPPPEAGPPSNVDLQPEQHRARAGGTSQTFVVTVRDAQGREVANEQLEWQTEGVGRIVEASERTDSDGRGVAEVHSEEAGTQTIRVNTQRCAAGADCTDTSTVEWHEDVVQSGPCAGYPEGSRTAREDADGMVIVGDDGDNILEGTNGDDIICGLGGVDKILGKAGNDELYGDNGQDDVRGHAGQDLVVGGNGHDTLYGNRGHDTLRGGRHNDVLRGGHHNDELDGERGHDVLRGGRRHDTLRGGNGNDELFGNRGNDTLDGGPGFDRCRGGPGRDELRNCDT